MNLDTYATINDLGHGAAIEHAYHEGWTLHTYGDPTADAVEDCTVAYAQECAQADPGLVWMAPSPACSVCAAQGVDTLATTTVEPVSNIDGLLYRTDGDLVDACRWCAAISRQYDMEPTVAPSRSDDDTKLLIENLDSLCGQRMDNAHDMGNDISLEDCVGYLRVCFGHDGGHFIVECIKSYNEGRDEDSDDQWELAPLLAQWDAPGSDDDGVQQVFDALDAVLASYTHRCAHSGCTQNYIDTGDTSCVDGETS